MGILEKTAKLVEGSLGSRLRHPNHHHAWMPQRKRPLETVYKPFYLGSAAGSRSATTSGFLPPVILSQVLANGTRRLLQAWACLPRPTGARHTPSKTSNASISPS